MRLLKGILLFSLLFYSGYLYSATIEHSKLWGTAVFIGPLAKDSKFRYYLEPQLRFIDNRYKFEEAFLYAGIGYETLPTLILFMGAAKVVSRNSAGEYLQQNRIWQQASWNPIKTPSVDIISRTRLEERRILSESGWAVRIRERILARFPLMCLPKHSLVTFDEVFLDLNHPKWLSTNNFLSQNRAFIGIGTTLSKTATLDVGYLNQYQFANPIRRSHILLFMLTVNA